MTCNAATRPLLDTEVTRSGQNLNDMENAALYNYSNYNTTPSIL